MWSRFPTDLRVALVAMLVALAAGCASSPTSSPRESDSVATSPAGKAEEGVEVSGIEASTDAVSSVSGNAGASSTPVQPLAPVPERAAADFARAVELMRVGNTVEAELEFEQLTAGYPQLSGPYVNLGILHRKAGRLEKAEAALRAAVERNAANAVAWTELGVTLRERGKFTEAAEAYERAIAADAAYAPAYRNLGVLADLYLDDPERALTAFERYRELSGEDKPVSSWIAELRQRTGRPAAAPAGESVATGDSSMATPADRSSEASAATTVGSTGEPS